MDRARSKNDMAYANDQMKEKEKKRKKNNKMDLAQHGGNVIEIQLP